MLQLDNTTPFAAKITVMANEQGVDTLFILARATFRIGRDWVLAEEQVPPLEADEYWGEPGQSSIRYPADLHLGKPATDILVVGSAFAPEQRPVGHLDVGLRIGSLDKTIRVFGNRHWRQGQISTAEPFATMPLRYENAFGGAEMAGDQLLAVEERNPVGRGFAGSRDSAAMEGLSLPNLEDPARLIRHVGDRPAPACPAPLAPNWAPRAGYAGTYDEDWQRSRAPFLPRDFDRRFFQLASPDLIYPGYLAGGEPVRIRNMHPGGDLQFQLPAIKLRAQVRIAGRTETPPLLLETLLIEPDRESLSLSWKAALPCDKKALAIDAVSLRLTR